MDKRNDGDGILLVLGGWLLMTTLWVCMVVGPVVLLWMALIDKLTTALGLK